MAQIDLLSGLKVTNASGVASSGASGPAKSSVAVGLFDQILTDQTSEIPGLVAGGNNLPDGSSLPVGTLSNLRHAESLQQILGDLSAQQQAQIDDLSFITDLLPAVDIPQQVAPYLNRAADHKLTFSDQQLQHFAVELGINLPVANLVLQSTMQAKTAEQGNPLSQSSSLLEWPTRSQVDTLTGSQIGKPALQPALNQSDTQTRGLQQSQLQAQTQAQKSIQAQLQEPQAKLFDALALNDGDVIKVRAQTSPASPSTSIATSIGTSVVASPIPTQSLLQQHQLRTDNHMANKKTALANSINKVVGQTKVITATTAAASQSSTSVANATIGLADALVQKLDQLLLTGTNMGLNNAPKPSEIGTLGSYTGANFKAINSQLSMSPTSIPHTAMPQVAAAEVSSMDLGQRFTSLMLGDSAAQLAARQMQDQLGQQLQRMVKEGRWQANLSLNPARLGQVNINLLMEDGVLQTQLLSANASVRELLESSLPRLKEQLVQSGLELGGVSVGSDSSGQKKSAGSQPDWQLSETSNETNGTHERVSRAVTNNNNARHDGDIDTFA